MPGPAPPAPEPGSSLDLGVGLGMRLCLARGLALGLGLASALCLLCLLWPWPGPVGAAWVVLSGRFSTSFLGFGQVRLIHEDGGECFTACEVVSQNCLFFCLNGFGVFGSNMGELPSPEFHFWKSMFFLVIALRVRISFLEMKFWCYLNVVGLLWG